MLKSKVARQIRNQEGMAIVEVIPIILVIVLLINFSLGFFGAIHTGILNSMASRNYAFETFRNRSDLTYMRDDVKYHYEKLGIRVHGTTSNLKMESDDWHATSRPINFTAFPNQNPEIEGNNQSGHEKVRGIPEAARNATVGVNPIWIKTLYGICLKSDCGT
jgi:hypothetical protein